MLKLKTYEGKLVEAHEYISIEMFELVHGEDTWCDAILVGKDNGKDLFWSNCLGIYFTL